MDVVCGTSEDQFAETPDLSSAFDDNSEMPLSLMRC